MLCDVKKLFISLDPIHMIAGNNTSLTIDFTEPNSNIPINLTGAVCRYVMSHFSTGEAVVNKTCSIFYDETSPLAMKHPDIGYPFTAHLMLRTRDTITLEGEYFHQFILSDFRREHQIPCEGRLIIQRSKDPSTTSPMWFINVEPGAFFATPNKIVIAGSGRERIQLYYVDSITQRAAMPPYDNVEFTSSDETVGRVENGTHMAGYVTGISPGECTITATVKSKPELTADINIQIVGHRF